MSSSNKINYDPNHFFDSYTAFYNSSKTGNSPNRLNNRYQALIHSNKGIIKNSSILDLASHDGRWSLAAIENDAKRVLGIEGREELVKKSFENMKKYGIASEKYSFVVGDIFEKIKELKPKEFDVVFCFGIFYHIMNHMLLLTEIKRLQPRYIILDTAITLISDQPIIHIKRENWSEEGDAILDSSHTSDEVLGGRPSKSALEIMLASLGFDFNYYDWENSGITNWEDLDDYHSKRRITFKKAFRYGGSIMKDFKTRRKNIRGDISTHLSTRRITLVAKNRSFN